jgi:hypothetical protein
MDHQEVLDKYVDPAVLKSTLINGFGIGNYETRVCDFPLSMSSDRI